MMAERRIYPWEELAEIPEAAGVYAWYYRHTITDYDIKRLIAEMASVDPREYPARVTDFLETHLFQPFLEEPYEASISGALKPRYQGRLVNTSQLSAGLVARIAADPTRLWKIKELLDKAAPDFASPIYIGMAKNLNGRISQHKTLIEQYRTMRDSAFGAGADEDAADHSFAREVVRRRFSVVRLAVAVKSIENCAGVQVDVENILNRINFPLCGRN